MNNRNFYDLEELRTEIFNGLISRAQIYKQVKAGEIPVIRVGKRILVSSHYVQTIMKPTQIIKTI